MTNYRKSLCLVLVLVAILLASVLPGCGSDVAETATPAKTTVATTASPSTTSTKTTTAATQVTTTPPPGTLISKDKPTVIASVSDIVGEGKVSFFKGATSQLLVVKIKGTLPVNDHDLKYVLGCLETIELEPNLSIPMSLFSEQVYDKSPKILLIIRDFGPSGLTKAYAQYLMEEMVEGDALLYFQIETVTVNGKEHAQMKEPYVIERISFSDAKMIITIGADYTESIVSGPNGAVLKKVGKGFLLMEGEAYIVD